MERGGEGPGGHPYGEEREEKGSSLLDTSPLGLSILGAVPEASPVPDISTHIGF
jgi:hypothetical protein